MPDESRNMLLLSEACESSLCGSCYKGWDGEWGWCQCPCHPLPKETKAQRRWRRLKRWRLFRRTSHCDLEAMRTLASKGDPDYVQAMAHAFKEVLGEDF